MLTCCRCRCCLDYSPHFTRRYETCRITLLATACLAFRLSQPSRFARKTLPSLTRDPALSFTLAFSPLLFFLDFPPTASAPSAHPTPREPLTLPRSDLSDPLSSPGDPKRFPLSLPPLRTTTIRFKSLADRDRGERIREGGQGVESECHARGIDGGYNSSECEGGR